MLIYLLENFEVLPQSKISLQMFPQDFFWLGLLKKQKPWYFVLNSWALATKATAEKECVATKLVLRTSYWSTSWSSCQCMKRIWNNNKKNFAMKGSSNVLPIFLLYLHPDINADFSFRSYARSLISVTLLEFTSKFLVKGHEKVVFHYENESFVVRNWMTKPESNYLYKF